MPVVGVADDQQIADFIKSRLQAEQQQGNLRGFNVDMKVEQGTVAFKGQVSNAEQEMLILKAAQKAGHLGVVQVVDEIDVRRHVDVRQQTPAYAPQQMPARQVAYQQQSPVYSAGAQAGYSSVVSQIPGASMAFGSNEPLPYATSGSPTDASYTSAPMAASYSPTPAPMASGYSSAPAPMAAGYGGGQMASGSPSLPGYAWPSYAAAPSTGNLSYPQQYSPSAWPYIGPFYPYPQVPLGWRKVSLEWDDGFWQLDFHDK
jgi:hypothetical protein